MSPEHLKAIYTLCYNAEREAERDRPFTVNKMDLHRIDRTLVTAGKFIREHGRSSGDVERIYKFNLGHYLEKGTCLNDGMAVRIGLYVPYKDIPLHINTEDVILKIILTYRLEIGE